MVPAGYQLPNNWRLGGAVHLDPFLVNAGSESTAEADEDVAGNPRARWVLLQHQCLREVVSAYLSSRLRSSTTEGSRQIVAAQQIS
jgi:hypothetical protein